MHVVSTPGKVLKLILGQKSQHENAALVALFPYSLHLFFISSQAQFDIYVPDRNGSDTLIAQYYL